MQGDSKSGASPLSQWRWVQKLQGFQPKTITREDIQILISDLIAKRSTWSYLLWYTSRFVAEVSALWVSFV